ncbi:WAS/WASL-interacting protein family member 1-like [Scylla paramamosain]|uniref:WAS/WASL-interacting protein family member 1-like n=1 Tax=Scylla paramamosain TaxID=85552 RepID=UPI003083DA53
MLSFPGVGPARLKVRSGQPPGSWGNPGGSIQSRLNSRLAHPWPLALRGIGYTPPSRGLRSTSGGTRGDHCTTSRPTPPARAPPPAAARSCTNSYPGPPPPADAPPPAPASHRPLMHHFLPGQPPPADAPLPAPASRPLMHHFLPWPAAACSCTTSHPAPTPPAVAPSRRPSLHRVRLAPARRRPLGHHLLPRRTPPARATPPALPEADRSGTSTTSCLARRRPLVLAPALAACSGPPSPPAPDRPHRLLRAALIACFGQPALPVPDHPRRLFRTALAACSGLPSLPSSALWVVSPYVSRFVGEEG